MDKNDKSKKVNGHQASEEKKTLPVFVKYGLVAVAVIIVIAVGLIIAFSSGSTVATVNGEKVSADEFRYYLEAQKQSMYYEAYSLDPNLTEGTFWATKIGGEDPRTIAKKKATDLLRDNKIQFLKAKAAKVSLTSDEVKQIDDSINSNIASLGNGNKVQGAKAFKKQYGFSIDVFRQAQVENYTIQKFVMQQESKISNADASVDKYYKSNPEWYKEDTQLRVGAEEAVWARHILFAFPQNATQADKDAAKKKAEDAIARLKGGEDFAKLAKELSEDPGSKDRGGDYMFGKTASFYTEFKDAAFALEPGQFTETPVLTGAGYHIIKVEEKYAKDEPVSLKCAKDYYEYGTTFVKYKLYMKQLDGWIKETNFKLNQSVYDSINVNASTTEAPIK